jgi:hypothetical protein
MHREIPQTLSADGRHPVDPWFQQPFQSDSTAGWFAPHSDKKSKSPVRPRETISRKRTWDRTE